RRLFIYVLLFAGSLLFAWPFIWMVGTSIKLEREVLSNRSSVLPERPIPRSRSPYLDDRMFAHADGPHRDEAIAILEEHLRSHVWPPDVDPEIAGQQVARGIYERLLGLIPSERWSDSREQLRAALTAAVAPDLMVGLFEKFRRVLISGQFGPGFRRCREDKLVLCWMPKRNGIFTGQG